MYTAGIYVCTRVENFFKMYQDVLCNKRFFLLSQRIHPGYLLYNIAGGVHAFPSACNNWAYLGVPKATLMMHERAWPEIG